MARKNFKFGSIVGFVGVGGEFDGKDASRIIAEKIVEKVSHK